jgi:hypothetical protein
MAAVLYRHCASVDAVAASKRKLLLQPLVRWHQPAPKSTTSVCGSGATAQGSLRRAPSLLGAEDAAEAQQHIW